MISSLDNANGIIGSDKFQLFQNYPNPFNPRTMINYQLPKINRVVLNVYDITGQLVVTLIDEIQSPGYHEIQFDAGD